MMVKLGGYDPWGVLGRLAGRAVEPVRVARDGTLRGADRAALTKRAGGSAHALLAAVDAGALRPGEYPVHTPIVWATETASANRNGDGFRKRACDKYHGTFVTRGRWFRHHDHHPDSPSYGRIVAAAYDPAGGRVDLLVGLHGTKQAAEANRGYVADVELEKLARGEDLPTSMGCVLDPSTPVLTADGYKPIADIQVGDRVFTHAGRWQPVTELHRRRYTGRVCTVRLQGLAVPLVLTADHPLRARLLSDRPASRRGQRPAAQWAAEVAAGAEPFDWVHTDHLRPGDRVELVPVTPPPVVRLGDTDLAELLGIYTAEGSVGFSGGNPNTVCFSIGVDDWAVRGVPELLWRLSPGVDVALGSRRHSEFACQLTASSAELARWCLNLVGQGSGRKRIPWEVFAGDEDCRLAFLGRWLDGDGWCDKKGLHWSSSNLGLVLQGRDLLATLGIPASIYRIEHKGDPRRLVTADTVEFTLNVSNLDLGRFRGRSAKAAASPHGRDPGDRSKPPCLAPVGGRYAYRVKSVETADVVDAVTYNFEVAGDESYSLVGVSSHNCKVPGDVCSACGNFARHRGEYCGAECPAGGCRTKLGQVVKLADGELHHLHVDNPDPTWFDASYVGRPAAPYAFAAKADWLDTPALAVDLARVKLAAAARGGPEPAAEDPALVGLKLAGLLGTMAAAGVALPLPPDRPPHPALAALSFRDPRAAGRSARALADEAVVLPLPAFARAAGREKWAAAAAPLAVRPDRLPADPLLAALAAGRYAPAGAAPFDLRMAAKSAASALSVAPARFAMRAAFADGPPVGLRAAAPDPAAADPEAVRLAVDHAAYKVAALVDRAAALGADFGLACRLVVWQELVAARG